MANQNYVFKKITFKSGEASREDSLADERDWYAVL